MTLFYRKGRNLYAGFFNDFGCESKIRGMNDRGFGFIRMIPKDAKVFLSFDNLSERFLDGIRYRWEMTNQGIFQWSFHSWGGNNMWFLFWEDFVRKCNKITYDNKHINFEIEGDDKTEQLICWDCEPDTIEELAVVMTDLKDYLDTCCSKKERSVR